MSLSLVLHIVQHVHASTRKVEEVIDVHIVQAALLVQLIRVDRVLEEHNGIGSLIDDLRSAHRTTNTRRKC